MPVEPELTVDTNVLCVRGGNDESLAISTANNTCNFVSVKSPYAAIANNALRADSPILSTVFLQKHYVASTCMSGKVIIHDTQTGKLIAERRDHTKWAVHIAAHESNESMLIATAGWDQKIHIYSVFKPLATISDLEPPACTLTISTNPECLVFVTHPDTGILYLIVSRRDSSFLHYYQINVDATQARTSIMTAGRQNLAPHSNAWVAFTPSALASHPSDPTLIAIATSHLPHLKVIIVRLLFPDPLSAGSQSSVPQTQASVARADLALQDKEDAAINLQVSTQAPQTPYSTPQIAWRPDGSGVWVNGDDGVVRGVEAKTGKVVALLRAHEVGSKVRTLWAGYLEGEGSRREILVSGGFDKKVFIWEVDDTSDR